MNLAEIDKKIKKYNELKEFVIERYKFMCKHSPYYCLGNYDNAVNFEDKVYITGEFRDGIETYDFPIEWLALSDDELIQELEEEKRLREKAWEKLVAAEKAMVEKEERAVYMKLKEKFE